MHVLDPSRADTDHDGSEERVTDTDVRTRDAEALDTEDLRETEDRDEVIDLSDEDGRERSPREIGEQYTADEGPDEVNVPPRRNLVRIRGMRIRRIRLWSLTKMAAVFYALGYAAVLASGVLAWNLANQLGLIADFEEMVLTSLGLETFEVAGGALFEVFAIITGALAAFAFVVTLLLGLIYNAATAVLGGIALETGPLRRPRRVFSLRHRRFVQIS